MTDLEKAIELARKHDELFGMRKREECCVAACQEMAEWKGQRMIQKACEWLEDMACIYAYWEYNVDTYEKEVVYDTEQLIKDFKKAMEE